MKYYQKQTALGSVVEFCLVTNLPKPEVDNLYRILWHRVFSFEKQCSRFLPASELSFFNRRAGTKQAITPTFRDVLIATKTIAEQSEGLFNPFILPALQAAGYDHSLVTGHENDAFDDHSRRFVPSYDTLEIGDTWARIPFNSALDLGGCGKGYIADLLVELLPHDLTGYWLSLGGDVVIGGCDENHTPWQLGIQAAQNPEHDLATIELPVGKQYAIATSGTTHRRGTKNGKPWHHLIDPRTLQPATTNLLVATVAAPNALTADVFASCACLVGDKSIDLLERHGISAALLQYTHKIDLIGTLFAVDAVDKSAV